MREPDTPDRDDTRTGAFFRRLRETGPDRRASERSWRRIQTGLTPRDSGWRQLIAAFRGRPVRPAWRFAAAATTAVFFGLIGAGIVLWSGPATEPASGPVTAAEPPAAGPGLSSGEAGGLVLLAPPALVADRDEDEGPSRVADPDAGREAPASPSDAPTTAADLAAWELDVRLVRGFDGAPPADALPEELLGAGGASRLQELRSTLGALLPFAEYALVGQWAGTVTDDAGERESELSDAYRLGLRARVDAERGLLRLEDVRLIGSGRPRLAGPMNLVPGQLYLLGVRGGRGEETSLVLAVRARPVPTDDAPDPDRD